MKSIDQYDIDPSILLRESWDEKAANPFHSLAALQKLAHHDSFWCAPAIAFQLRPSKQSTKHHILYNGVVTRGPVAYSSKATKTELQNKR